MKDGVEHLSGKLVWINKAYERGAEYVVTKHTLAVAEAVQRLKGLLIEIYEIDKHDPLRPLGQEWAIRVNWQTDGLEFKTQLHTFQSELQLHWAFEGTKQRQ